MPHRKSNSIDDSTPNIESLRISAMASPRTKIFKEKKAKR